MARQRDSRGLSNENRCLLARMVTEGASDGFIPPDAPPVIKVDGEIFPMSESRLR